MEQVCPFTKSTDITKIYYFQIIFISFVPGETVVTQRKLKSHAWGCKVYIPLNLGEEKREIFCLESRSDCPFKANKVTDVYLYQRHNLEGTIRCPKYNSALTSARCWN